MKKPKKINLGVLYYHNKCNRYASSNIGDYIQTLSILNLYKKIVEKHNKRKRPYTMETFIKHAIEGKVKNFNFVFIKRDNLSDRKDYEKYDNIITIFHGWWMHPESDEGFLDFNIPKNIKPVFVSFHISKPELYYEKNIKLLKRFEPIGCRDMATLKNLKDKKVKCYFSGCSTSTIDFFKWKNESNLEIGVDYGGTLSKNIQHQNPQFKNKSYKEMLLEALRHLKLYSKSKLVKTSRLHCYIPCVAMGVPVDLISPRTNERYNRFGGFLNIHKKSEDFKKM